MTFDEMCKLAAEIEVAPDGWRPVRMQRYDWGWRLHVELDTENTMSIATYKPWSEWRRWHEHGTAIDDEQRYCGDCLRPLTSFEMDMDYDRCYDCTPHR